MRHYQNQHGTVLVLARGEELIESLNNFAKSEPLASAYVAGGVGGADQAVLAFYDFEARDYNYRDFDEGLEILSLQGNLSWVDDEPFWHVHGTLSGADYQAIGGHIKQLRVALTCEILIVPLDTKLTRTYDETTGLKLLGQE